MSEFAVTRERDREKKHRIDRYVERASKNAREKKRGERKKTTRGKICQRLRVIQRPELGLKRRIRITRDCIARKEEPYMSRREIEQEDEEEKNRDWDCGRLRKES